MNNLVTVNVSQPDYTGKLSHNELKHTGEVELGDLTSLTRKE